jgi:hypothetical protein
MKRAWSSGYDNDTQVRRILERVQQIRSTGNGTGKESAA